jgi:hypothetical protein
MTSTHRDHPTGLAAADARIADRQQRAAIRAMLTKRYHGAIEPTDALIDAVLDGLAGDETGRPQTGLTRVATAAQIADES